MGNCECYNEENGTDRTEFTTRSTLDFSRDVKERINSEKVMRLPETVTFISAITNSTIRVDAAPSSAEVSPPVLNDLVKNTMLELPDLQYDEVERG